MHHDNPPNTDQDQSTIQFVMRENEALKAENERLRQHLAAYEQFSSADDDRAAAHETAQELRTFRTLVEHAPDGITIVALNGVLSYANPAFRALSGYGDATVGKHMADFRPPEENGHLASILQQIHEHGVWKGTQTYQRADGTTFDAQVSAFMIYDEQNRPLALMGIHRDITEQQAAEAERQALQQQVIEAQQAAIRELSTPLLPLAQNVIVLPLIGAIDATRAQQIMETLLEGIALHQADTAILDVTGVEEVDTQVAQVLIQTTQAVKLLGAQVVLTGIQPQIAQTLVHLGVELRGIVTYSTLQAGIARVLHHNAPGNGALTY